MTIYSIRRACLTFVCLVVVVVVVAGGENLNCHSSKKRGGGEFGQILVSFLIV